MTRYLSIEELNEKAREIRNLTLDMCVGVGTGHVTSSFSCTEILTTLYYGDVLRQDPKNPKWEKRDRFILSKGQASPVLYATLADRGYYPKSWLETFCKKDGRFGVHLQNNVPGVEISTGSLGHGLGIGCGMALAEKIDRVVKDHYFTFVLLGDGELYEGSNWESAMFARQKGLNNLIAIVDRNGLCATDYTEHSVRLNPLDEKWKSFGWEVKTVDGHSIAELLNAFKDFRAEKRDRPYVIIAETIKGKGAPYIENQILWHARAPSKDEAKIVREQINSCPIDSRLR
jgi:transketolase